MQENKHKKQRLMWLFWLAMIVFSSAVYAGEISQTLSAEVALVEQACRLIYEGKFEAADGLIRQNGETDTIHLDATARRLSQITEEYKGIAEQRQKAQDAAYAEAFAELQEFREETDLDSIFDANDTNDLNSLFSVIAKAGEFAGEAQKEKLLADPFVKQVVQKAIDKAARFEVDGKWLDAYTNCYGWLVAIDSDNKGYSDYSDQLLEKASLAMVFEDSPCETSEERFQGVRKEMFVHAINFLDSHYVSIIDYNEMATKVIERCKLLAEVLAISAQSSPPSQEAERDILGLMSLSLEPEKRAAWSSSLDGLLDEVKSSANSLTGLGKNKFLDIFEKVLQLNETTVDLPESVLISQFAGAALAALDPYTIIIWPKQVQDFEQMMTNEFMGIGIEISKVKGRLTVSSLLVDTPAYNSALDAGDVIEKVEGVPTKDMTLFCAAKKIKGPAGTKVTLTVRRPNDDKTTEDKVFDITITRDKIVVPTVRGWQRTREGEWLHMIDEESKIGYVRLTSFSSDTAPGLEGVLRQLERAGMRGLILDLRSNTGGLLDSAVSVADKFVEEGFIVSRQPRAGQVAIYEEAHRRGTHPDYPLVILINSRSASASEIVAGALADPVHKRAILVGNRTHGKGSVQGITGYLGRGAQLKYTMAYYHLPSGRKVESQEAMEKVGRKDWGVGPNVEVVSRNDELKKMREVQRHNDVLVKADHEDANEDFKKHTIEETLASDPQLAVGLLVVRSKLLQAETLARAQLNN
ncbi:MAG: S41 family peptidase [Planctomycetota bacterium]|jgi:carboxyl-terminal processing protease